MITNHIDAPAVRFPEFVDDWENTTLGSIAKFSKGKGISKADIAIDGTTECIRYGELYTYYGETISEIRSKTNLDAKELVFSESNDIIIPASGESEIDIATASCVLKAGVALGGDLNIIKTNNDGIFLAYYLNNNKKKDIAALAQGVSVVHLYSSQLKSLNISFPSFTEQQKIASFLTAIDAKIDLLSKKKSLLEEYKKGVMQQLFSQQIRFKDDEGNEFPEWEKKNGNYVFESVSDRNHNSDLPILAITQDYGAIPRDLIDFDISVTDKSVQSYKVVQIGDFIISLRSFQGGIEYSSYKGICSPAYIILRPIIPINDYFFKSFLKTEAYIKELQRNLEGIRDGKMISYKYFSDIVLPVPSLPEQKKIATFLSTIDSKIDQVLNQLGHTRIYKKGLLQQLFA